MEDTEKIAVLQEVTEAKEQIGKERVKPTLTDEERDFLDDAYDRLNALQNTLILEEIKSAAKSLGEQAAGLEKVAEELSANTKKLSKIAKRINDVAKAVAVLTKVAAKAASSGIL